MYYGWLVPSLHVTLQILISSEFFCFQIRRLAIKSLPDICRGATDTTLCTKVADLLTQLLLSGMYRIICRIEREGRERKRDGKRGGEGGERKERGWRERARIHFTGWPYF